MKYKIGDKKKFIEIKKNFKIDKFDKILNSKDRQDVFTALKKVSKVDISFFDGFTEKIGLVRFFKKISNNLSYESIISFHYDDYPNFTNSIEFGLLKCVLNKKDNYRTYLIESYWSASSMSIPQGDLMSKNCFNSNKTVDQKSLLKIVYEEIKWNFPSKILANDVYLSKKFNWSKEKLKKCIKNSKVRFY